MNKHLFSAVMLFFTLTGSIMGHCGRGQRYYCDSDCDQQIRRDYGRSSFCHFIDTAEYVEQQKRIATLEKDVKKLEAKIAALEKEQK